MIHLMTEKHDLNGPKKSKHVLEKNAKTTKKVKNGNTQKIIHHSVVLFIAPNSCSVMCAHFLDFEKNLNSFLSQADNIESHRTGPT